MKIIITEDDSGIEDVLKMMLEKEGHQIELIPDGMDLINNNFIPPDLFIIDMVLSGINGLDLCRFLKKNDATRHIPVILTSASSTIGILAKNVGADGAMEKPFKRKNLLKMVSRFSNNVVPASRPEVI